MAGQQRSPWVYVGVGCLVSVLLVVAVVVGIGVWGVSRVRELQRTMADPVARSDAALHTLGADKLPEGYYAMMSVSAPFGLMDTAMLTDREPDARGLPQRFGQHGFIYFETLSTNDRAQKLRDFFSGDTSEPDFVDQFRVDTRTFIARGTIEEAERTLRWVTYRGEVGSRERDFDHGLIAMVMFECPGAERVRVGTWFGPDPAPDTPADEADLTGTVADPVEIQRFMAYFHVCRERPSLGSE